MQGNFQACLALILESEGGFSNDPADSGGPTNLGVTLSAYSTWIGRPATVQDIRDLTPAVVAPLYRKMFWNASHCDYLPLGVDLMVFDEAVNEGPGTANRHLQQALSVPVDGLIGPVTINAAVAANTGSLIAKLAAIRTTYYEGLNKPKFINGWLARIHRTAADGMAMTVQHA